MSAGEEIANLVKHPITGEMLRPDDAWAEAAKGDVAWARAFADAGYHKQLANRHQEPYSYFSATITATSRDNYYGLRRHGDAQPEIHALADAMWEAEQGSVPRELKLGEWHTPWIEDEDRATAQALGTLHDLTDDTVQWIVNLVSAARCARSSYRTYDGIRSTVLSDFALCQKLIKSNPIHASPFESVCTPDERATVTYQTSDGRTKMRTGWYHEEDNRNFKGFRQLRAYLERGDLTHLTGEDFTRRLVTA